MPAPSFNTRDELDIPESADEAPTTTLGLYEPGLNFRGLQNSSSQRDRRFEAFTERHRRRMRQERVLEVDSRPEPASSEGPRFNQVNSDSPVLLESMALAEMGPRSAYRERTSRHRRQRFSRSPPPSSYQSTRVYTDLGDSNPSPTTDEGDTDGFPYYPQSPAAVRVSARSSLATTDFLRRAMENSAYIAGPENLNSNSRIISRIVPHPLHGRPHRMYRSAQIVIESDDELDDDDNEGTDVDNNEGTDDDDNEGADDDDELKDFDMDSMDPFNILSASQHINFNRTSPTLLGLNVSPVPGAPPGWGRGPPPNPTQEIRRIRDDPPEEPHITWTGVQ